MSDPGAVPKAQDIAETTHFLRRFAGLMANGQNATYLHRTADLLEALAARVSASSDEEQLWRYKYETLSQQNDALERECEELRHDIERHVKLSSSIIAERDVHKTALDAREAELRELGEALKREREALKQERQNLATQSQAHTVALAEQHSAFDQERSALQAKADASNRETDQLRGAFERDRDELAAELARSQMELTELRTAFDGEREELNASLKSRADELAEVRADVAREREVLNDKAEALEAKRVELRSAFERISQLRVEPERHDVARFNSGRDEPQGNLAPALAGDANSLVDDASAIVPKETLRQARAQFEFLAKECLRRGDVATQAMCELGAHAMQLALAADESADASPIGRMACSPGPRSSGRTCPNR